MLRVSMCVLSYTPLALAGHGAVTLGFLTFSSLKMDDKGSHVNRVDHTEGLDTRFLEKIRTDYARVKAHES